MQNLLSSSTTKRTFGQTNNLTEVYKLWKETFYLFKQLMKNSTQNIVLWIIFFVFWGILLSFAVFESVEMWDYYWKCHWNSSAYAQWNWRYPINANPLDILENVIMWDEEMIRMIEKHPWWCILTEYKRID